MGQIADGKEEGLWSVFLGVYSQLKAELLQDPAFDHTEDSREWVEKMLDYNVFAGKRFRGFNLVQSYQMLNEGTEPSQEEIFLACVLGWCVEWMGTYLVVFDDIMDNSLTRRGKPCWFRLPEIGLIAINDGIMLRSHIFRILKNHFKTKPYYADLVDLFNEIEFQTTSGEMLDLMYTNERERDLGKYNWKLYRRLVEYKTAYYSFYISVACALLLSGKDLTKFNGVKDILVEIGVLFQAQDDFLDCYGDPNITGKIGSDIEEFKCTWLVVQALESANQKQKNILMENYGKVDTKCVSKVKNLYKELDLEGKFIEYEKETYKHLVTTIEAQPSLEVRYLLEYILRGIYKRKS